MEVGGCLPEEKTGGILFPGGLGWPPIWASGKWTLIAYAFLLSWSHAFILPKEFYFQFLKSLPLRSPNPWRWGVFSNYFWIGITFHFFNLIEEYFSYNKCTILGMHWMSFDKCIHRVITSEVKLLNIVISLWKVLLQLVLISIPHPSCFLSLFPLSRMLYKTSHTVHSLLWHNGLEIYPCCCIYPWFAPSYCWIEFHCRRGCAPQFVYPAFYFYVNLGRKGILTVLFLFRSKPYLSIFLLKSCFYVCSQAY